MVQQATESHEIEKVETLSDGIRAELDFIATDLDPKDVLDQVKAEQDDPGAKLKVLHP